MKLVKNIIKNCQFCENYQSILSDVDKHQRSCQSNPDRLNTLQIDHQFDEDQFLERFGNKDNALEDSKDAKTSTKQVTSKVSKLDLNRYDTESEEENDQHTQNRRQEKENSSDSFEEAPQEQPKVTKPKPITNEDLMILPHLHKHDMVKKKIYDKPSTWICGGYFTELGCLNTFNCLFKHIDFEFPHYQ